MTTIFIARHGQTQWNLKHRWQGHADPPLNDAGRAQSIVLAEAVAELELDAIYSSDLLRARETAEIVAAGLGLGVTLDARLREVDVGEWSGLTSAEIEALYPDGVRRRQEGGTGWEHGETNEAHGVRIREALVAIADAHQNGRVLAVTHGGSIYRVWVACGGVREDWHPAGNCDLDEVAVRDGQMRWIHSTRGGLHQQVQG